MRERDLFMNWNSLGEIATGFYYRTCDARSIEKEATAFELLK